MNIPSDRPEKLWTRAILIASLIAMPVAAAQDAPAERLATVTVTGTRIAAAANRHAAMTVIDAATIESHNKPTVPELLAEVEGIHSSIPGGRGSVGEIIVRGGEPNFTAVLVDGVQMNDPTNTRGGSFDFSTLDINEIESIEFLRGPLSSIYGSDALSGIININTHKSTDQLASQASATFGSEQLASASARIGGPTARDGRFTLSASSARDGHADSNAGYRSNTVSGSLDLLGAGDTSLLINARHSETALHAFPDSSGGPRLAVLRDQSHRQASDDSLALAWRRTVSTRTRLNIRAAAFEHAEDTLSPGIAEGIGGSIPGNDAAAEFSRQTISAFLSATIDPRLSTVVGMGYERQDGTSSGSFTLAPGFVVPTAYSLARDNVAVFGELAYAMTPSLTADAALRFDDNDTASPETTSKLGLTYSAEGGTVRLRLGWANGYKLPSLFSLGDPLVGNPALQSETVSSWELGADIGSAGDRLNLHVTAFWQRFENLIDFDFEQFMSVNRDQVDTDGLEIGVRYRLNERAALLGHGTWVDIDVRGSAGALRQRPERSGGLGIEWSPSRSVTLYAGWRYVGARLDASIPTGEQTLPGYTRTDTSLRWRLSPTTSVHFAIDNVTGEQFEDAIGFPNLGARLRITLRTELLPRR